MFCSACGDPLRPGARFCSTCGAAAPLDSITAALSTLDSSTFCPSCGLVLGEQGRYCQHCSACSQCGVRRAPAPNMSRHAPAAVRPAGLVGERIAASIALDGLLVPYVLLYAMPFLPSFQAWWWTTVTLWCGNIVAGNITGQSLGKRLLHIRVARAGSSAPPGLVRGLVRSAVYLLTGGPVGLAALWVLFHQQGRGLHDLLAATEVMHVPATRSIPAWRRRPV